ncbi:MAG TPA: hypothetical protein VFO43_07210 [Thiobacillus sp.]|nr:hypothetical protein [Thiobacillus sp.]
MAGIAIGRDQVCAVVLDAKAQACAMRGINRHALAAPLFAGPPTAEAEAALAAALQSVGAELRAAFAAVHVALPDTVIRSAVFELDELPKSAHLREALLRWRFSREWQRPEESLECRGVDLGADQGKRLFFGQAGDRPWIDCVRRALVRAEITPWSLNAAASYRFNRFHDAIAGGEGALLSLDPDCWNLLLWDETGRVRRVVTRLRANATAQDEMKLIADEAERAILAHARGLGSSQAGKLYLAGSEAETAMLAVLLEHRLQRQAVPLHADQGIAAGVAGMREDLAPLALAAALNA